MAYTQADLDSIDAAIADGNLTVRMADRMVTRRSIDELLAMRSHIAAQLQAQSNAARTYPRFQTARFDDA
jgi:hypothetical protein